MFLPLSIESNSERRIPYALVGLIGANLWVHALVTAIDTFHWMGFEDFVRWFAFDPDKPTFSGLFLSMFTHAGWFHLIGNMVFLWAFGWVLEDRLGWKKFLGLYLGCGVLGSLIQLAIYWAATPSASSGISMPGIGASGCVMAVVGLTLSRYHRQRVRILNPFIAPLILWFLLMVFMPEWRDWLASYLLIYLPLCYILPITARKMVYRIPLWILAPFYFIEDYAAVVRGVDDEVNHVIHAFCFLVGLGTGWLLRLPQEDADERLLERAREDARNDFIHVAVSEYLEYLKRHPEDPDARCELADFYLRQGERERFFLKHSRAKALTQYQWVLEEWLDRGRELDAVKLYRSLRGSFQDDEYKPALLQRILALGEKDKALSMKAEDRRVALEEEVRRLYAERLYPTAYTALGEWWKLGDLKDAEPAFLTLAADIFHRLSDPAKEERVLEFLAEHGNDIQAERALLLLSKLWMGTPKQRQLKVVLVHVRERLPSLRASFELENLQQRLG